MPRLRKNQAHAKLLLKVKQSTHSDRRVTTTPLTIMPVHHDAHTTSQFVRHVFTHRNHILDVVRTSRIHPLQHELGIACHLDRCLIFTVPALMLPSFARIAKAAPPPKGFDHIRMVTCATL